MLTSHSDSEHLTDGKHEGACPANSIAQLRVLATTDLHMNMASFDYYTDSPDPSVGLTRTASLIHQARSEANNANITTLLFDNGDTFQGTPLGETTPQEEGAPHIMVQALNLLEYDAIGLGNHDFNFGLTMLEQTLSGLNCPVVASNSRRLNAPPAWHPYAILDRAVAANGKDWPLRIGVLSLLPPQALDWDAHLLKGEVEIDDILLSAQKTVRQLKAQGCHLVIALAHTGLKQTSARPKLENAAIPLAAIEGLDALVAGHTHLLLPGQSHQGLRHVRADIGLVHNKPTVMPGSAGSHLGVMDLTLTADGAGGWQISDTNIAARPICSRDPSGVAQPLVQEDPDLVSLIDTLHEQTRHNMRQPVSKSAQPLHSYFTFFAPDRGLAQVAAAQAAALRAYVSGTDYAKLPLLSATAPSKFGGRAGPDHYTNVPAGPILMRHVADLHIFPNELHGVVITGAQLRDWLEMAAGLFQEISPGADNNSLINPDIPGHNFDVIFGVEYLIDPSRPARFDLNGALINPQSQRIRDLTYSGKPIDDHQEFVVAVNNFRANGGGHFSALSDAKPLPVPSRLVQHVLRDYLMGRLPRDPLEDLPFPWHFLPQGKTRAMVHTSPSSTLYLNELHSMAPIIHEQDDMGFIRYSLVL